MPIRHLMPRNFPAWSWLRNYSSDRADEFLYHCFGRAFFRHRRAPKAHFSKAGFFRSTASSLLNSIGRTSCTYDRGEYECSGFEMSPEISSPFPTRWTRLLSRNGFVGRTFFRVAADDDFVFSFGSRAMKSEMARTCSELSLSPNELLKRSFHLVILYSFLVFAVNNTLSYV